MSVRRLQKWIIAILLIIDIIVMGYVFYPQERNVPHINIEKEPKVEVLAWMTNREIPKDVDLGSYLVAFSALQDDHFDVVADKYLNVLKTDPENDKIAEEAYFINAMLVRFDNIKELTQKLSSKHKPVYLSEYVLAMYAARDGKWQEVRDVLAKKDPHMLDGFLRPLLVAWSYAGEHKEQEAYKALEELTSNKDFAPYYAYHKGLLGMYFKNRGVADEAFNKMGGHALITVSLLPEIRSFYATRNLWNLQNSLFMQTQLLGANRPATLELMLANVVRPITPIRGMAEALYNVSTAIGGDSSGQEAALILNALSLYMWPKELLPLLWGSEILDTMNKPVLAGYYYNHIRPPTPTLKFKKAMNLLKRGQKEQALVILDKLKATNMDSVPLWLALADVYAGLDEWQKAGVAYTRAISSKEAAELEKDKQAEMYFARAFVYDKLNESQKAESDLLHALDLNPENSTILNQLGYRWLETKTNREKGFDLVKKAYKLKPDDPYIMDSMAYGYFCEGDYARAVELAEKSVDAMPQSSVSNAHLGDIYGALGRKREAKFQYNKALALTYDLTPELKKELHAKLK